MQAYAPLGKPARVLPDHRLRQRLDLLVQTFAEQPQRSIPQAMGNRNDMDAAYAFFDNRRVCPSNIVASCLPQTLVLLQDCSRVLALQDTSDLNYSSLDQTDGLGHTDGPGGKGLKLHSTLAVRPDGLPLGLLTQQIWARDPQTKGRVKQRRQRDAQDKESFRWQDHAQAARSVLPTKLTVIHVADREGDIYDWLAADRPVNTHLLVRVAQAHRMVVYGHDGVTGHLAEVIRAAPVLGQHTICVPRADDKPERPAVLTVRVAAMHVQPPRNAKQRSKLQPVPVWVIEAYEETPPAGSQAVCWRLVTTEPVQSWEEALRALAEYILRWRIERFHYTLKSGCRIEQLQLEEADRLANAVAVYSQVAVRVQRLTYQLRLEPEVAAATAFSVEELQVLQGNRQRRSQGKVAAAMRTLAEAVAEVARLGGHLGRKGDGPPGVKVLWRGLQALHDQVLGYRVALNNQSSPPQRYP
jgi:Transposase DNA-binding/Transposase Tn5 dimerisation domain